MKTLAMVLLIFSLILVACGGEKLQADAGEDFVVNIGDAPTFDGCGSTGDIENYQWSVLSAPDTRAEDSNKVIRAVEGACQFTLEDTMVLEEIGEWVIQLTVRDTDDKTATDTVKITVRAE